MVWLAPKQEYNDDISEMGIRWAGETVITEVRDEALSQLVKMVWNFHRIIVRLFSNPDDKAAFQAEIYIR